MVRVLVVSEDGEALGSVRVEDRDVFAVDGELRNRELRRRMGTPLSAEDVRARGVKPLTDEELASLFGGV
jgi:hypothetical protein